MAKLGMPLFIIGVIVAACYASFPVRNVEGQPAMTWDQRVTAWGSEAGVPFALGLAMVVAGGLMARTGHKKAGKDTEGKANGADPRTQLGGIHDKLHALPTGDPERDSGTLHSKLDALLEEDVPAFLEHRQSMIDSLGLAAFAEMIGQFAAMERNAARAWSCVTDEAWVEVDPSLERARTALGHAINAYDKAAKA